MKNLSQTSKIWWIYVVCWLYDRYGKSFNFFAVSKNFAAWKIVSTHLTVFYRYSSKLCYFVGYHTVSKSDPINFFSSRTGIYPKLFSLAPNRSYFSSWILWPVCNDPCPSRWPTAAPRPPLLKTVASGQPCRIFITTNSNGESSAVLFSHRNE